MSYIPDQTFFRTYSPGGIAYLWPYRSSDPSSNGPIRTNWYVEWEKTLKGWLPSIHDMEHVEHLSGVFSNLWPAFAQAHPFIQVGLTYASWPAPLPDPMTTWSDYTPYDWPGAAISPFGKHPHMELWTGQLGFHG